jgi:predicted membrane-bound mannosyltransferase
VYGYATNGVEDLADTINGIHAMIPEDEVATFSVYVIAEDYWPLPWYIRQIPQVGYFDEVPSEAITPTILLTDMERSHVAMRLGHSADPVRIYGLLPERPLFLFTFDELWKDYLGQLNKINSGGGK